MASELLWPEAAQAIEWAIERRRKQPGFADDALLCLTDRGLPFAGQTEGGNNSSRIGKHWSGSLLRRVLRDYPNFRRLPPKSLRKTSGNMIREIAGGEIMAVFHCRGQAVKGDHLADVYSNRPFGKVFRAIEQLRENLQPMFESVQGDPFPRVVKKGGPNIILATIERIRGALPQREAGLRDCARGRRVGIDRLPTHQRVGQVNCLTAPTPEDFVPGQKTRLSIRAR